MSTLTTRRRWLAKLAAVAALAMLWATTVVPAQPASALSVYCGAGFPGVELGYAAPRDNGHPAGEPGDLDTWNGVAPLKPLRISVFTLEKVSEGIGLAKDLVKNTPDPTDEVDIALQGLGLLLGIAEAIVNLIIRSLESAILALEQQNEEVDECGGALLGDFVDVIFVTQMEEELARIDIDGATGSAVLSPSMMYLLPSDGFPAWTRDASRFTNLPGHAELEIPYVDGTADGLYIGLASSVRDRIALMDALGIPTGAAKDHWTNGATDLGNGNYVDAYSNFARAYQAAVHALPAPAPAAGGAPAPAPPPPPPPPSGDPGWEDDGSSPPPPPPPPPPPSDPGWG